MAGSSPAAVLTASIGVNTGIEPDIGTIILGNDGAGGVAQTLRGRRRVLRLGPVLVTHVEEGRKTVGGIVERSTTAWYVGLMVHESPLPVGAARGLSRALEGAVVRFVGPGPRPAQ